MQDDTTTPTPKTRRRFLKLAGFATIVGAAYGGTALLRRLTEPGLEFEPIADIPGFRRVADGPISGGAAAFVGIGDDAPKISISNAALCRALFGPDPDPARVRIAYFTDVRCAFCREVSPMLAGLDSAGEVAVTWHELPLLGRVSSVAARASLAARAQGAYAAFHKGLMGAPVLPTPPVLRALADRAGIDPDQLLTDMNSDAVERQLQVSAALAARFGFYGTPALVIGRTAMLGGVTRRKIDQIIAAERQAPLPGTC